MRISCGDCRCHDDFTFGSQLAGEKGFSAVRVPHYLQFEAMSRKIVMGNLSVKPVVVDRLELVSWYVFVCFILLSGSS